MKLTVFNEDPDKDKAEVDPNDIACEVRKLYEGVNNAIILDDPLSGTFMQSIGTRIEFHRDQVVKYTDADTVEEAIAIFSAFLEQEKDWVTPTEWKLDKTLYEPLEETNLRIEQKLREMDQEFELQQKTYYKEEIRAHRKKIDKFKRRIAGHAQIMRWEWNFVTVDFPLPRSVSDPPAWSTKFYDDLGKTIEECEQEAISLAIDIEAIYWIQTLQAMMDQKIVNVQMRERMLRDTLQVDTFLEQCGRDLSNLKTLLAAVRERLHLYKRKG